MINKIDTTIAILLIAGLVFSGGSGCRRKEEDRSIDRIILVTLDTLRADHLSCYSYPRETSPFIDSLAAGGCRFLNTFAPMPLTVPSHASIFTSRYPIQLNVLKNSHSLNDSAVTLAEVLRESGYHTAAFISTTRHFRQGNLLQGFEHVEEPDIPDDVLYLPADKMVDTVISWLENEEPTDRFFLWLHLYDTHSPYNPPPEILDQFEDMPDDERNDFLHFLINQRQIDPAFFSLIPDDYLRDTIDLSRYEDGRGRDEDTMLRVLNAYDGEVRFLDTELERLFRFFESMDVAGNTLWIIASDHGEGLGNHQWLEHGKFVFNEQIHVPLIFHCPGLIPPGKEVEEITGLVDILPTIAELTGISFGEQSGDRAGTSLAGFLFGAEPDKGDRRLSARSAFAQRQGYQGFDPEDFISPEKGYKGEAFSLQNREHKYILRTEEQDGFYNLTVDPYELDNLAGNGGDAEREMKEILIDRINYYKSTTEGSPESMGTDQIERLKALGYAE